jgi:hypothetical protein
VTGCALAVARPFAMLSIVCIPDPLAQSSALGRKMSDKLRIGPARGSASNGLAVDALRPAFEGPPELMSVRARPRSPYMRGRTGFRDGDDVATADRPGQRHGGW